MNTFERLESAVRSYCRTFPVVFERGEGCHLIDEDGKRYLDFFAGAGVLNYGHNPAPLRDRLLRYIESGGITHSLDMYSTAKRTFLERFEQVILEPRGYRYRVQFPGPTGTNAVESALKLARKATGRRNVITFTNAFHGMTLGALAITGNAFKRAGAGVPLCYATPMPFDGYLGAESDTLRYLQAFLEDQSSGVDLPAAIILETVQAEGGVNVASFEWIRRLSELAREHGIVLIVDDIQVGCGRTGPFFSFEPAGITPDVVCVSKSLSGYGLPMAIVLIRPDLDVWNPGEHNGTFRGHNLAFVTAAEALSTFWADDKLRRDVEAKGERVRTRLEALLQRHPQLKGEVRGRGLIQGVDLGEPDLASAVSRAAFERGLIVETAGVDDSVLKVLPPLVIEEALLDQGLEIIDQAVAAVLEQRAAPAAAS